MAENQGSFPAPGPYVVGLRVTLPGASVEARAGTAEANAVTNGWTVADRADLPGAVRFEIQRGGVAAGVSVRTFEETATISVQRDGKANSTRRNLGMAVGALVGLAVGGAVLGAGRR